MGFFQAFLAKSQRRHALDILCKVTKECTLSTSVIRVGSICSKLGYTQKIGFKKVIILIKNLLTLRLKFYMINK